MFVNERRLLSLHLLACVVVVGIVGLNHADAANGTWDGDSNATWGTSTNWTPATLPGTGNTATFNSAGNGSTTIDLGGGATINTVSIDTASAASYSLGSILNQPLTLDNGGQITLTSTQTRLQQINSGLILGTNGATSNFSLNNNSGATLYVLGNITGSSGSGTKTLTTNITGDGSVIIGASLPFGAVGQYGAISDGGGGGKVGLIVNNTGAGVTTLNQFNANTFTGDILVKAGTLNSPVNQNATTWGSGTITLGDSSGSFNTKFSSAQNNNSGVPSNNFIIAGGNTGTATISSTGNSTFSGSITLGNVNGAHDLTLLTNSGTLTMTGAFSGSGNLILSPAFTQIALSGANAFNFTGSLTHGQDVTLANSGTATTISRAIGSSVTGVTQNSNITGLTLSGANLYTGTTTINAGTITVNAGASLNAGGGGTDLTFNGTGTLVFNGGAAQGMKTVTLNAGNGAVTSSGTGSAMTIANVATRSIGATINFTPQSSGTITLTQFGGVATPTNALLDRGAFVNSNNYAAKDSGTGFVRAYATTDANAATSAGGASNILNNSANNVFVTGNQTAQNTAAANTLNLTGARTITMSASNQTLSTNGILNNGNGSSITGGSLNTATGGAELVIYTGSSGSNSLTIGSTIVDNGTTAVTKSGVGTLTLSGPNTYTGTTYITNGLLSANNATALGNGGGISFSGALSGSSYAGTLQYTAASAGQNWSSRFKNSKGPISLDLNSQTVSLGAIDNTNTGGLVINGNINAGGAGTLTLTGNNTFSGGLTINNGGTVNINHAGAFGTGTFYVNDTVTLGNTSGGAIVNSNNNPIILGGGNNVGVTYNSTQNLDLGTGPVTLTNNRRITVSGTGSLTIGGAIGQAGGRSVQKGGTGTLILTGANTYTGTTTINSGGGVLNIRNGNALGLGNTVTVSSGTALELQGGITVTNHTLNLNGTGISSGGALRNISGNNEWLQTVTLSGATRINSDSGNLLVNAANSITGANNNLTLGGSGNGKISGSITTGTGTLTKDGTGTWTLTGPSAATTSTGAGNNFAVIYATANSGTTTISAGTLQLGDGTSGRDGSVSGAVVNNAALVYNLFGPKASAGAISGSGTVTKNGLGTQILGGALTYTGGTTISGGSLVATSPSSNLSNGGVNVGGNTFSYQPTAPGALSLGSGTLTLGNGSTLGTALGGSASQSAITSSAAASFSGTGKINISGVSSGAAPAAGVNDLVTAASGLSGGSYSLGTVYNNTNFTVSGLTRTPTAISATVTLQSALSTAYWKGGLAGNSNVWAASDGSSTSNWTATAGGATQALVPGSGADVNIAATSPTTGSNGTVLGANMTIKSLTIADTSYGLGLNADGYTLTVTPSVSTAGITMSAGVPNSTIGANMALGANQTWTNNSASNLTVSGVVSGANTLTIAGAGPITLSGANTFTGNTSVSAGSTLIATSPGALAGNAGSGVTVAGGGAFNYAATSDAQLAVKSLAITGNGSTIIGSSIGGNGNSLVGAEINVNGVASATGSVKVNIFSVSGVTPRPNTNTFTLVHGGGGSSLNSASYTLNKVYNNTNFTVGAFTVSATDLQVSISSATAISTAYWTGGLSGAANVWAASDGSANSNWVTSAGGGATGLVPGYGADVNISASSVAVAPTSTVLGANMTIKSLTIADTVNGLGLVADGNTLTVDSAAGITVASGVPSSTLGADLGLGADQTWTNNSVGTLTITGVVKSAGALTKAGSGTFVFTGANTYTGATNVNNGTLLVNGDQSLATGTVTVNSGGTLGGTGTVGGPTLVLSGGKLAPGASIDELIIDDLLDISGATSGPDGSQLFELGAAPISDRVTLTSGNVLTIGTMNYADFVFSNLGVTAGTYTLFDTDQTIVGSLGGGSLSGTIGAYTATLSFANSNQDIVLTLTSGDTPTVPEPATLVLLGLGSLGLAAYSLRKRLRRIGQPL